MDLLIDFLWLGLVLALLAGLQLGLHREVQLLFLLITRNPKLAIVLFSLVFLPGVFLHELSHFLSAKLLGVRTGRFSIIPQDLGDGRLQLGFVEVARADPLRESLIGAAPLLAGSVFVAYAGLSRLGLDAIWLAFTQQGFAEGIRGLSALIGQPDVWLWVYLALAVSSTMFPSATDRPPIIKLMVGVVILLGLLLTVGAGVWLLDQFGPGLRRTIGAATVIFGISVGLHLLMWFPLVLIRLILMKLMRIQLRLV